MAVYIVSYDLNGPFPTHAQVDARVKSKAYWRYGRVLETVWYIRTTESLDQVYNHFDSIMSENDRLMVVEATGARWKNLLINSASLKSDWES